jgi:catechol 2,3-dioxygenase
MFPSRRLAHVNLFVSELERSMRFYHGVCGLEEVFREPPVRTGFLSNGNTHHDVALVELSQAAPLARLCGGRARAGFALEPGLFHLGFELESEAQLVAAYRSAAAAGLDVLMTLDHKISRSVYLLDPEGNVLEFYADCARDWRAVYAANEGKLLSDPWTPGEPAPCDERRHPVDPEIRSVPGAPFQPLRIAGAELAVRDLERALRFYRDVAGLRLLRAAPGSIELGARCAGNRLALVEAGPGASPPLRRIEFEVAGADGARRIADPDGIPIEFSTRRPQ